MSPNPLDIAPPKIIIFLLIRLLIIRTLKTLNINKICWEEGVCYINRYSIIIISICCAYGFKLLPIKSIVDYLIVKKEGVSLSCLRTLLEKKRMGDSNLD